MRQAFPDCIEEHNSGPEVVKTPEAETMELCHSDGKGSYKMCATRIWYLKKALYCPVNHVVMNEKRDVVLESINRGRPSIGGLDRSSLIRKKVISISGPATALRAPAGGYYHTLIDCLPRIEYLFSRAQPSLSISLLRPEGETDIVRRMENYFLGELVDSAYQLIDIDYNYLYEVSNYLFIPSLSRPSSGLLPSAYISRFRKKILPDRASHENRRIYISRGDANRRQVSNERELLDVLSEYGFECYELTDLTLEEQIELFYDAEIVVSPHGAGLTNILFSRKLKVLELHSSRYVIPHFYYLSKSLGHDYRYILNRNAPPNLCINNNAFQVNIEQVKIKVHEMLSEK